MKVSLLVFAAIVLRPFAILAFALVKLVRPVQHKVTFITRQSDSTPVDFVLLAGEFSQQDRSLKQKMLCCSEKTRSQRFMGHITQTFLELWHIANSSVVILDGYALSISYFPQRKNLFVLQMWHTLGGVKSFSWQTVDMVGGRDSRIAHAFRMHANYTALLAPGKDFVEPYRHAFRTARSRIHVFPLPRADILRSPDFNRIDALISDNPDFFVRRPLILYVPTFRDDEDASAQWIQSVRALIDAAEEHGATIILKAHSREPALNDDSSIQMLDSPNLILNPEIDTMDLLSLVDHVITDYSGVAFEAAAAGKPLWFYIPDYNDYRAKRGLNVDVQAYMPNACFADAGDLMDALTQVSLPSTEQSYFLNSFVQLPSNPGVTSSKQIARFVLKSIQ